MSHQIEIDPLLSEEINHEQYLCSRVERVVHSHGSIRDRGPETSNRLTIALSGQLLYVLFLTAVRTLVVLSTPNDQHPPAAALLQSPVKAPEVK